MEASLDIFICYRREDAAAHAGRLADALADRFGRNSVFMDVDTIEPGIDFTDAIDRAIGRCDVLIALIGPHWLDAAGVRGRRLDDPQDLVRLEIEAALDRNIRVIPTLIGGAGMPHSDQLPGALARMAKRNAFELSDKRFRSDFQVLLDPLQRLAQQKRKSALAPEPRDLKVAARTNLPKQLTNFVGRKDEIEAVKRLLAKSRLVTLTGPGGIGKTRLAIEVAGQMVDTYEDGVWLVDLASLTDPELVPRAAMTVLGLRDRRNQSSLESLMDFLTAKHTLMVFDNCEHVVDAIAGLIESLLQTCGGLQVLATSREVLGIRGEEPWQVTPLQVPGPGTQHSPEDLERYEAVALFAARASTATESFHVTRENASAVSEVCQRLDGIPLAVELAAARLTVLSLAQVRDRLNDRFSLLAGGSRTALPRQQTLRAAIDWSYQLLAPAEQALLCRLSVFSGGCGLDGVEAVCLGGQVAQDSLLDLLSGLVHKSLLIVEPSTVLRRYRLLDTIREFARQQLQAAGEVEQWCERHFEWCLALTIEGEANLHGRDQLAWIESLETEHDNIRAAFDWGCARQDPRVLVIASNLDYFWSRRGHLREGYDKVRLALSVGVQPTFERAEALTHAARLATQCAGDYFAAREFALESLRIRQQLEVERGLGFELMCLGSIEGALGNIGEALLKFEQAEVACRSQAEPWPLAVSLNDYGLQWHGSGETGPGPRTKIEESVAILRGLGDDWTLGAVLDSLGQIDLDRGDLESAARSWTECCRIALKVGDGLAASPALDGMGKIAVKQGDFARGLRLHAAAAHFRREVGQTLHPGDQEFVDVSVAAARQALDARHAEAIWEEGGGLNLVEAINYGLVGAHAGLR